MAGENDIVGKKVWSTKEMFLLAAFCISVTFTDTKIYDRFLSMEKEIITNEERSTKQYNRNAAEIDKLKDNHPK